jgi:hypothetical protein
MGPVLVGAVVNPDIVMTDVTMHAFWGMLFGAAFKSP